MYWFRKDIFFFFVVIYDLVLMRSSERKKFHIVRSINRELNADGILEKSFSENFKMVF